MQYARMSSYRLAKVDCEVVTAADSAQLESIHKTYFKWFARVKRFLNYAAEVHLYSSTW